MIDVKLIEQWVQESGNTPTVRSQVQYIAEKAAAYGADQAKSAQLEASEPTHYIGYLATLYTAERAKFLGLYTDVMTPLYAAPVQPKAEPLTCDTCTHFKLGALSGGKIYDSSCVVCSQYYADKHEARGIGKELGHE